jgi:hypothetical protein
MTLIEKWTVIAHKAPNGSGSNETQTQFALATTMITTVNNCDKIFT